MNPRPKTALSSSIVLAATAALCADAPAPDPPRANEPAPSPPTAPAQPPKPEPGTLESFFDRQLPDVIGKSKISLNARLRWEWADQDAPPGGGVNPEDSNAVTLRTRFGLTTGSLYGFQGMLEGENIAEDPPYADVDKFWLQMEFNF